MAVKIPKRIPREVTALCAAAASVLTAVGLVIKVRGRSKDHCDCDGSDSSCSNGSTSSCCSNSENSTHIPEPSVKKIPRVKEVSVREPKPTGAIGIVRSADSIIEIFEKIKVHSPSNEGIAKIIISLINLQNAVSPEEAVDVRSIHFMKSGNQNTMVIDFYTDNFGNPAYEEELERLWGNIFLAENFWNADFVRVRVSARAKSSGEALEVISCNLEDVSRYLLKDISIDEFHTCWVRRKAKSEGKAKKSVKPEKLKRA